ncbi:MAG: hypothetical protein AAFR54_03565 [Planctomycetota bacterium]
MARAEASVDAAGGAAAAPAGPVPTSPDGTPLHEPGDPDLMIPVVGTPEPSPSAIEVVPLELLPAHLPISDEARGEIVELVRAMQPLKESLTSDHHDRQFILNKRRLERLFQDERKEVGWAALHAFTNYPGAHTYVRQALLEVGARVSPEEAAPLLEALAFQYEAPLSDRAEALLLLGEIAPEAMFAGARPYLERKGRRFQTAPQDEFFVEGWLDACEATGTSAAPMLAQVATNFALEPRARYLAVERLSDYPDDALARGALETALVESTGDNYIRIKAAQSIVASYGREEACELLEKVLSRETSLKFAAFLDDTIQSNCR